MDQNLLVIAIIVINVLFSWKGFEDNSFFRKYEFHIGSILSGEQWRMISSGFLHVDWLHLGFNMFALYSFGDVVVSYFGIFSFVLIYFSSLILGNLLTFYFNKNNYSYRAVGASGAVTGIIYSAILLFPYNNVYLFFIPIGIPAYIFGFIYLLYSIYGMKSQSDNIGHSAHIGGAIAGYILTLSKEPILFTNATFIVVLLAIPIVILIVMAKQGKL